MNKKLVRQYLVCAVEEKRKNLLDRLFHIVLDYIETSGLHHGFH